MAKIKAQHNSSGKIISRHIYGHFAEHLGRCIYGGFWVGKDSPIPNTNGIRNDVIEALRELSIPNLRWPGGCFADEYHWQDGLGLAEQRPTMINTHWGGVTENNHFGTHEFMELCELLGCEPYICGNLGSGTVQEMSQWVEYLNSDNISPMTEMRKQNGRDSAWNVKYFGVGNENWGCGGLMTAEYYAGEYRRYSCYCRNYGDKKLFKIACGPNTEDYHWTEVLMREAGRFMDGLSLHYYSVPRAGDWRDKGPATGFHEEEWFTTIRNAMKMDELVTHHSAIMDKYDPERKVALIVDEWGTWYNVEPGTNPGFLYQQNTLRDALVAAIHLNIFNKHCGRVRMTNIAQTVNVLQAMLLTEGEKMLKTPTWHVFRMFKVHHDAKLIPCTVESPLYKYGMEKFPAITASCSQSEDGSVNISLSNSDPANAHAVSIELPMDKQLKVISGEILTAATLDAHNSFESPDTLIPEEFTGAKINGNTVECVLPEHSVVVLKLV